MTQQPDPKRSAHRTTVFARPSALIHVLGITIAVVMTSLLYSQSDDSAVAQSVADDRDTSRTCIPNRVTEQFVEFDANRNGWLDADEHHAMIEARRSADLQAHDRNRDGRLSLDEFQQLLDDQRDRYFRSLDTDSDARISRHEATRSCTPIERQFDDLDRDGSGEIDRSEFDHTGTDGSAVPQNS